MKAKLRNHSVRADFVGCVVYSIQSEQNTSGVASCLSVHCKRPPVHSTSGADSPHHDRDTIVFRLHKPRDEQTPLLLIAYMLLSFQYKKTRHRRQLRKRVHLLHGSAYVPSSAAVAIGNIVTEHRLPVEPAGETQQSHKGPTSGQGIGLRTIKHKP